MSPTMRILAFTVNILLLVNDRYYGEETNEFSVTKSLLQTMSNPPLFVGFGGIGGCLRQDFTKWPGYSQIQIPGNPHGLA